eukprot:17789-Heterococcus_DN1.PRE.3
MDYHPDQHQTKIALLAVPAVVCVMYAIVSDNSYVSTSASDAFDHTSCKSVVHTATKLGIALLLHYSGAVLPAVRTAAMPRFTCFANAASVSGAIILCGYVQAVNVAKKCSKSFQHFTNGSTADRAYIVCTHGGRVHSFMREHRAHQIEPYWWPQQQLLDQAATEATVTAGITISQQLTMPQYTRSCKHYYATATVTAAIYSCMHASLDIVSASLRVTILPLLMPQLAEVHLQHPPSLPSRPVAAKTAPLTAGMPTSSAMRSRSLNVFSSRGGSVGGACAEPV